MTIDDLPRLLEVFEGRMRSGPLPTSSTWRAGCDHKQGFTMIRCALPCDAGLPTFPTYHSG